MRKCSACHIEMVEGLNLLGDFHGEKIKLGERLPKKITIKAAVCPECGKIELYTEDLQNVKKLVK